jgi:hypothetical protein
MIVFGVKLKSTVILKFLSIFFFPFPAKKKFGLKLKFRKMNIFESLNEELIIETKKKFFFELT